MSISIGQPGPTADLGGTGASSVIQTALLSQVEASQTKDVEALFSSIGLGANTNSAA